MSSLRIIIHGCKILFTIVFQDGVHRLSAVDKFCPVVLNKSDNKTIHKTTFTVRSVRVYF